MEKCSNCQAPTVFGPGTASLVCEHCGTKRPITPKPAPSKAPIESADAAQPPFQEGEARVATCNFCGASTEFGGAVASTRCAFCDGAIEPKVVQGHRAPARAVVPFEVPKKAAGDAFHRWLGSLWFRPNDLKKQAKLEVMDGAYVPSWRFDTRAYSQWSAEAGYTETRSVEVQVNGRTETRTEQYTRWEPASGSRSDVWEDLVTSASQAVRTVELHGIEPFDFTKAAGFDGAWLAGFEAESLQKPAKETWPEARQFIEQAQRQRCANDVPGNTHRHLRVETEISTPATVDALLPIYVAAFRYRDKVFRVLVNGQSAKVNGQAPWSAWKITTTVILAVVTIAGVIWYMQQR